MNFQKILKIQKPVNSNRYHFIWQAVVWIWFGLFGKIYPLFGNHYEIVLEIFNSNFSGLIISIIGVLELVFGLIILSGKYIYTTTILQIILIGIMNSIEVIMVPEYLLFGKFNFLLATLYCTYLIFFYSTLKTIKNVH